MPRRIPGASGGNPRLDPWKATAIDLSIEKYFAKNKGYISLAGFHKKLDTYIYDQTIGNYDFTSLIASSGSPVVRVLTSAGSRKARNVSAAGGMDIEEVAHATPEKILKEYVDPATGLTDAQAERRARRVHRALDDPCPGDSHERFARPV